MNKYLCMSLYRIQIGTFKVLLWLVIAIHKLLLCWSSMILLGLGK